MKFESLNNENHSKIIELLASIPLFNNFTNDDLFNLLHSTDAKVVDLEKNEILFNENTTYNNLCILISGEIVLYKSDEYGNRNIIDIISSPKVFAEVFSFTTNKVSPVTAQSNKDSKLIIINTDKLNSIDTSLDGENIALKHKLLTNLLNVFANKNLTLLTKIEVVSRRNIREKILRFLEIEKLKSKNKIFDIAYNRQEMADFLGVDRSALSRELSKLKDEGIIDFEKNKFKLL